MTAQRSDGGRCKSIPGRHYPITWTAHDDRQTISFVHANRDVTFLAIQRRHPYRACEHKYNHVIVTDTIEELGDATATDSGRCTVAKTSRAVACSQPCLPDRNEMVTYTATDARVNGNGRATVTVTESPAIRLQLRLRNVMQHWARRTSCGKVVSDARSAPQQPRNVQVLRLSALCSRRE